MSTDTFRPQDGFRAEFTETGTSGVQWDALSVGEEVYLVAGAATRDVMRAEVAARVEAGDLWTPINTSVPQLAEIAIYGPLGERESEALGRALLWSSTDLGTLRRKREPQYVTSSWLDK